MYPKLCVCVSLYISHDLWNNMHHGDSLPAPSLHPFSIQSQQNSPRTRHFTETDVHRHCRLSQIDVIINCTGLTVRKTWHIILINTYCLMLNLLLKIVCSFDERQWWLQQRQQPLSLLLVLLMRLLLVLLLLFFHFHALYLFHSLKYLLLPCAIFCWHMHLHTHTHTNIGIYWAERLQLFNTVIVLLSFSAQYTRAFATDLYFSLLFFSPFAWAPIPIQYKLEI